MLLSYPPITVWMLGRSSASEVAFEEKNNSHMRMKQNIFGCWSCCWESHCDDDVVVVWLGLVTEFAEKGFLPLSVMMMSREKNNYCTVLSRCCRSATHHRHVESFLSLLLFLGKDAAPMLADA